MLEDADEAVFTAEFVDELMEIVFEQLQEHEGRYTCLLRAMAR